MQSDWWLFLLKDLLLIMYAKDELTKKSKQMSNLNQNSEVYNVCLYVVYLFV